ncbi:hypothetical protein GJ496_001293 [Pomphorhynchus laevis]|nr:hypothetical protein GJ496_001293 [Pomphorhynchus laevis]
MSKLHAFVTVGTTRFDKLINAISNLEFLTILINNGFEKLTIQYGSGQAATIPNCISEKLQVIQIDFKSSIGDILEDADLVISHAGSGTLLETLRSRKPTKLVAVCNNDLMDNHQIELANKLASIGCLICCENVQNNLVQKVLTALKTGDFKRLEKPDKNVLKEYIESLFPK